MSTLSVGAWPLFRWSDEWRGYLVNCDDVVWRRKVRCWQRLENLWERYGIRLRAYKRKNTSVAEDGWEGRKTHEGKSVGWSKVWIQKGSNAEVQKGDTPKQALGEKQSPKSYKHKTNAKTKSRKIQHLSRVSRQKNRWEEWTCCSQSEAEESEPGTLNHVCAIFLICLHSGIIAWGDVIMLMLALQQRSFPSFWSTDDKIGLGEMVSKLCWNN